MPALPPGSKVLVSGASGYIALWVVRLLLERGYHVRGTVRADEKGEYIVRYAKQLGYGDKFEYVIVKDIAQAGAFDEAVKDVDAIEHTASPFTPKIKEADDLIRPAVQGTVGMLQSALKYGSQVKRIVVTSSVASVMSPPEKPTRYSELDWNTTSPKQLEELGEKTPPMVIYRVSKVLAERAAWDFYENHKSEIAWDLAVINPPFVFGPPIHEIGSLSSLNTSLEYWYDAVIRGSDNLNTKNALAVSNSWVDVRDTALGHVLALEKEAAGGERIITSGGTSCKYGGYIWQEWLSAANALPVNPIKAQLQRGFPEVLDENPNKVVTIAYNTSKSDRILGIKYKTIAETTKDTLEEFARRGW